LTKSRGSFALLLASAVVIGTGCSDQTQSSSSQPAPNVPQPPVPPVLAPAKPAAAPAKKAVQKIVKKERVKAEVGVGEKTRHLENPNLVKSIITPARVYFRTRERIAFEIQIPHALQLYKAMNGHAPRNQEEFMQQIIKANHINLPKLRAGERYIYDPKTEQLMVERPAKQ